MEPLNTIQPNNNSYDNQHGAVFGPLIDRKISKETAQKYGVKVVSQSRSVAIIGTMKAKVFIFDITNLMSCLLIVVVEGIDMLYHFLILIINNFTSILLSSFF